MPDHTAGDLLPAQLFLLCCHPDTGRLGDRQRSAYAVRAAVLGELLLGGHLVDMEGSPEQAVLSRLTDPVLQNVAAEISASRSRSWRSWLRRNARPTLAAVQEQLVAAGIIRIGRRPFLGLFSRRAVEIVDQDLLRSLHERIRRALDESGPVPAHDAMLVALVVSADLRWVLPRSERRAHRSRIGELVERSAPVAPLLRKVISSMRTAGATAATYGGS